MYAVFLNTYFTIMKKIGLVGGTGPESTWKSSSCIPCNLNA